MLDNNNNNGGEQHPHKYKTKYPPPLCTRATKMGGNDIITVTDTIDIHGNNKDNGNNKNNANDNVIAIKKQ